MKFSVIFSAEAWADGGYSCAWAICKPCVVLGLHALDAIRAVGVDDSHIDLTVPSMSCDPELLIDEDVARESNLL